MTRRPATLEIAAFRESRVSVRVGNDAASPLLASFVTGNYFDVLGVVAHARSDVSVA